jgi:phosphatidylglycerol:prolipoprotein diacylglycerol transferase
MPTLHDPVAVSLGPLDIRWYALFILSGIFAAIGLSSWLAAQRGLESGFLLDIAPWVVFLSIGGARLYYVLLEWDSFRGRPLDAINFRGGGLSIHGAIIVGILVLVVLCRSFGQPTLTWMDLIVPGVALGQAIGRWGNWANQEAFGKPTDLPWAVTIDPSRRPDGYEAFATFHPTFLYESVFNLVNAAALTALVLRQPRLRWMQPGDVTGMYLIGYGVARLAIERMRTDSLYIGPLPAALWLSMALILGGLGLMIATRLLGPEPRHT